MAKKPEISSKASDSRRIQTRRSGVHGKGVFALQALAAGETVLEYVGEIISWPEAQRRHPHDPKDPNHTFYFHIDEDHVIDALFGGNSSRWINHSCDANCEADEEGGRVFKAPALTLDLAGVTEVDSPAVSLLLEWRRAAQREKRKLDFVNYPANLKSLIQLYGVTDLLR